MPQNAKPTEHDCRYCFVTVGQVHEPSCPHGERYQEVQRRGGIPWDYTIDNEENISLRRSGYPLAVRAVSKEKVLEAVLGKDQPEIECHLPPEPTADQLAAWEKEFETYPEL